jgi:hypothetical protein
MDSRLFVSNYLPHALEVAVATQDQCAHRLNAGSHDGFGTRQCQLENDTPKRFGRVIRDNVADNRLSGSP